ncbi:Uncharacterized protein FWK35_00005547, partial [Aphis craccivora]
VRNAFKVIVRRHRPLRSALVVNNSTSNYNKVLTENNIRRQEIGNPQNNNKNKSDSSFMSHHHSLNAHGILKRLRQYDTRSKLSSNKNEGKHGRYDAHKHHDTMGEIVQGQEFPDMKNKKNHVDLIDNNVKEVNPHSESLGSYQIDKYGNCVERDLKYHHSST